MCLAIEFKFNMIGGPFKEYGCEETASFITFLKALTFMEILRTKSIRLVIGSDWSSMQYQQGR